MPEDISLRLAALLILGISAQWLAWRLRVPAIIFLLTFGILAGAATGFLEPEKDFGSVLLPAVSLGVAIILFEGGLTLRRRDLPEHAVVIGLLVTIGALVTLVATAAAAKLVVGLPTRVSLLLGAILVVTGPTVVGPLLDIVRPNRRLRVILKWEGIVIDPIGAVLAVLIFEALAIESVNRAAVQSAVGLSLTLAAGIGLGFAGAAAIVLAMKRYLIPDHLQSAFVLMMVIAVTVAANEVRSEAGLAAATAMGIFLANQSLVSVTHITEFKENLRVLLIGSLFIVLGARLDLDSLGDLGWKGPAFVAILILLVRPLAVAASTFRSTLSWQERTLLACMAPRGIVAAAVSSVFAIRLTEAGEPGGEFLVPLTFAVIIGTIVIYGLAAVPLARRLEVADVSAEGVLFVGCHEWARALARTFREQNFDVLLIDTNPQNVLQAHLDGLPAVLANVLSEAARDELDLRGIGHVLAVTSNDEVNTLAVQRFKPLFGGSRVFQLAPDQRLPGRLGGISHELHGRIFPREKFTYAEVGRLWEGTHRLKATRLSESYDYGAFSENNPGAIPFAVVSADRRLLLSAADRKANAIPGDTIVSIIAEPPSPQNEPGAMPELSRTAPGK